MKRRIDTLLLSAVITVTIGGAVAPHAAVAEDWNQEAVTLQKRGDWNGVLALAERWTRAEPKSYFAWMLLGVSDDQLHRNANAISAYKRSIALAPSGQVPYMAYMGLASDYHALGQIAALKAFYAQLEVQNPQYAAIIGAQYRADLTAGSPATRLPSGLPALAARDLAQARKDRPDAVLTMILIDHEYGRYQIELSYYSPSAREVLNVIDGAPPGPGFSPLVGSPPHALPQPFIDLPIAIAAARRVGFHGTLDSALLIVQDVKVCTATGLADSSVTWWQIDGAGGDTMRYLVNPVTGKALSPFVNGTGNGC
jgi:tetratricopeptide (TPR) repeat protein